MINITDYNSSDSSDTDGNVCANKETVTISHISSNECNPANSETERGEQHVKNTGSQETGGIMTDFFNLQNDSSSDEECARIVERIENKSNTDSTFWKGNDHDNWGQPSVIWNTAESTSQIRSNSVKFSETFNENEKIKTEDENWHVTKDICVSHTLDDAFSASEINLSKYQAKRAKITHSEHNFEQTQLTANTPESNMKMKSIYQVHSKINALMSSNVKCKTSRKIFSSLNAHAGMVNKIEWCAPQYSHLLVSASMDKCIKIWDVFAKNSKCVRTLLSHSKAVKNVCWSRSGREILSCSYDKSAAISDAETGKVLTRCNHENFVSVAKYHPVNFNYFVTGTYNKLLCWDFRNTTKPTSSFLYKDVFGQVQDLIFLQDGRELITCNDLVCRDSADRNIMAWDFCKGVVVSNQIYQERFTCARLQKHPTEAVFIAQTQGDYIAQFSAIRPYKMNKYKRFQGHKVVGYNIGCDFSSDGNFVVSGSSDGQVLFYDFEHGRQYSKINLGKSTVCLDVAWHPILYSTVGVSTWDGNVIILQ